MASLLMSKVNERLIEFGYTQKWIDCGLLTEEILSSQVDRQRASGDSNYEHFRYESFKSWIQGRTSASDDAISSYVDLVFSDPDRIMAGSAIADLIDTPWITDGQFEFLVQKVPVFGPWTETRVLRARIFRELDKGRWSQELFENALVQKDRAIHERLLLLPKLTRSQLEKLAEQGSDKGIRARAEEALKSKRFRNG